MSKIKRLAQELGVSKASLQKWVKEARQDPLRIHSSLGNLTPNEFEKQYYEKLTI